MFLEANNQRRFISPTEVITLFIVAFFLHVALFWWLLKQPAVSPPEIPQMMAAGGENTVMIELASSSQAEPVTPEPTTEPQPLPPDPPPVEEDEDAVRQKEPEKKALPVAKPIVKPAPVPKPRVTPSPRHESRPVTPSSTASTEQIQSGNAAGSNKASKSTSTVNSNGQSITPAISGMQALGNPPPEYPTLALRRRQEGSVILRILVLENGKAGEVVVTRSSRSELLDKAAINTVQQWHFIPAKRGSMAIKGYAIQTITFRLPQ